MSWPSAKTRPTVRPDEADDHVEAGCLAGAVGTEQADDLSLADLHADAADDLACAVGLSNLVGFKRAHQVSRFLGSFYGWNARISGGRGCQ